MTQPKKIIPPGDESGGSDQLGGRRYLTLGINISGSRCLVVGGGRVGSRKVSTFIKAGAEVTVLAPSISAELQKLAAAGQLHWLQGEYDVSRIEGFLLVVAATSDQALNLRIAADAEERGILSCNVSSARRSRVIFPALYEEEEITVAVHSHGHSCRRSQSVRNEIADWLLQHKHQREE